MWDLNPSVEPERDTKWMMMFTVTILFIISSCMAMMSAACKWTKKSVNAVASLYQALNSEFPNFRIHSVAFSIFGWVLVLVSSLDKRCNRFCLFSDISLNQMIQWFGKIINEYLIIFLSQHNIHTILKWIILTQTSREILVYMLDSLEK